MRDQEQLWEVNASYEEIGCPPSESIECSELVYVVACSRTEAKNKAKETKTIRNIREDMILIAKEYRLPVLTHEGDFKKYQLEVKVRNRS